jgi:hypothetical protein
MPRDGAIILGDLVGKLDVLRVSCGKCGCDGCYGLGRLIEKRGRNAKLIDWLDELTADCPKKMARNMNRAVRSVRNCRRCCKSAGTKSSNANCSATASSPLAPLNDWRCLQRGCRNP